MRDEKNNEENSTTSSGENHDSSALSTSVIDQGWRDMTAPPYETNNLVVRFATDEPSTVSTIRENGAPPLFSLLTPDICTELWYQPSELAACRDYIRNVVKSGGPQYDAGFSGDLARCSRDRVSSKRTAIQCVLAAQKLQKGADVLGMVSRKCSSWVCDIALTQAHINFCEVNEYPLPSTTSYYQNNDSFFSDRCIKRKQTSALLQPPLLGGSTSICGERRVRRRMTFTTESA